MADEIDVPWFIQRGEQRYECPDEPTLKDWYRTGRVLPTDLVFHASLGEWRRAANVLAAPTPTSQTTRWITVAVIVAVLSFAALVLRLEWHDDGAAAAEATNNPGSGGTHDAPLSLAAIQSFIVEEHSGGAACEAPLVVQNLVERSLSDIAVEARWPAGLHSTALLSLRSGESKNVEIAAVVPDQLLPERNWQAATSTGESYALWNAYLADRRESLRRICVNPLITFRSADGAVVPHIVASQEEQDRLINERDAKVIKEFEEQHFGGNRPH